MSNPWPVGWPAAPADMGGNPRLIRLTQPTRKGFLWEEEDHTSDRFEIEHMGTAFVSTHWIREGTDFVQVYQAYFGGIFCGRPAKTIEEAAANARREFVTEEQRGGFFRQIADFARRHRSTVNPPFGKVGPNSYDVDSMDVIP